MNSKLILVLLFLSTFSFGQLSGDLVMDGRKVTQTISYQMQMKADGQIVFDISVNTAGKVTSCVYNQSESTIRSTRYIYEAKNRILMELHFEAGNGFPTYHKGRIIITSEGSLAP